MAAAEESLLRVNKVMTKRAQRKTNINRSWARGDKVENGSGGRIVEIEAEAGEDVPHAVLVLRGALLAAQEVEEGITKCFR